MSNDISQQLQELVVVAKLQQQNLGAIGSEIADLKDIARE